MTKIRFTKDELKRQKDSLKRFSRYLPTLELKQKQLQQEIARIQADIERLQVEIEQIEREVSPWVDVFAEEIDLAPFLTITEVQTQAVNVAGVDIPQFLAIEFTDKSVDLASTPLWVDTAIDVCKEQITRKVQQQVAEQAQNMLREELEITVQRINLFEKVKIPEARGNIRVIQIRLGDLQTAEVVRAKIAKAKMMRQRQERVNP